MALTAGSGTTTIGGSGGYISIRSGSGNSSAGGSINFTVGEGAVENGGSVVFQSGETVADHQSGGIINITGGSGTSETGGRGGSIRIFWWNGPHLLRR